MALAMIEEAERRGELRAGMTVVEYSAGSTGSSLAYVCAAKGYRLRIVSSDAFAVEKLRTIEALGAELVVVPSEGGKVTPDLVPRMIERAAELAAEPDTFWTDQLNNADSLVGYRHVGIELMEQLDRPIDVFCASVGTAGWPWGSRGHSPMAGRRRGSYCSTLRRPRRSAVAVPARTMSKASASGSVPRCSTAAGTTRRGGLMRKRVVSWRAVLPPRRGCLPAPPRVNVVGALQLAGELGAGGTVVTVACDTGLKYLAGDLYRTCRDHSRGPC